MHKTDYILTFGDYFSNYIRSSSKNISIGNLYLESKVEGLAKSKRDNICHILFITQRDYTDTLISPLRESLEKLEKPYTLTIRLHPSDNESLEKYNGLLSIPGTNISSSGDIYSLIVNSDYIVGSYSTALFESVCFGKIPFVHDNDLSRHFSPSDAAIFFSEGNELYDLLNKPPVTARPETREYFWKSDSKANFWEFLKSEGIESRFRTSK